MLQGGDCGEIYCNMLYCILVMIGGWDGCAGLNWDFWVGWLILCDTASVVDDPYATSGWVIDVMWRSYIGSLEGRVICR